MLLIIKIIAALFPYKIATRAYNKGYHQAYEDVLDKLNKDLTQQNQEACDRFCAQFELFEIPVNIEDWVCVNEGNHRLSDPECSIFRGKAYAFKYTFYPNQSGYAKWGSIAEKMVKKAKVKQ